MKQHYRLNYPRLFGCIFFLLISFLFSFVTKTHSHKIHNHQRLWPLPPPVSGPGPPPGPSPEPSPSPSHKNKTVPAVFFFGDSIIDTGNNNNLSSTEMKCNFRPYGIDFPRGIPTGRFSNGKVVSDYISEQLGVKPTVPAYLNPKLQPEDLPTGVSFASGGSGYHHLTAKLSGVISMVEQLTHFKQYITRVKRLVGQEKTDHILARGLAVVIAGSNDLAVTYYGKGAQWLTDDIHKFTSKMANFAASFVMQLYGHGAKQIAVTGAPPLGCMPSQRTLKGGIHRECARELNYASQLFNAKLSIAIDRLAKELPDSNLIYLDIYSPFSHISKNQQYYGFEEITKGCCGTGLVEVGPLCNQYTTLVCSNISAHLFWDSFHPTQRFYKILVKIVLDKYGHLIH